MMSTPAIRPAAKNRPAQSSKPNVAAVMQLLSKLTSDMDRIVDGPLPRGEDALVLADAFDVLQKALQDLRLWLTAKREGDRFSELIEKLEAPSTPRVFRTEQALNFIRQHRPGIAVSASWKMLGDMEKTGALLRVTRGLYVNEQASPPVVVWEVAERIRMGAVISLHSVLGECGVLNNPTDLAVAVVPSCTRRPKFEAVRLPNGAVFWFYQLDELFFRTGPPAWTDVRQTTREYPVARAEAALLHWLYLASVKRSMLPRPPLDVDLSALDMAVLKRLAHTWGVLGHLTTYRKKVAAYAASQARYEAGLEPLDSPGPTSTDAGLSAHARLVDKARRFRK